MRLRKLSERVFAVKGTPTDCVIMGVRYILRDETPSLVLSGVNRGANLADDVTYSGTIAGAIEGTMLGIPSIAMSLAIDWENPKKIHWETPMELGANLVRKLMQAGWPLDVLMNVNFPDREPGKVQRSSSYRSRQARPGLFAHRRPHGYEGQSLLLARLQIAFAAPGKGTDLLP